MNKVEQLFWDLGKKIENIIIMVVVLFIFKVLFNIENSIVYLIVNEIIVLLTFGIITVYFTDLLKYKITSPISVIINTGIFNAIIFFFGSLATKMPDSPLELHANKGIFYEFITTVITLVVIFAVAYIFAVLRSLFSLWQKKDNSVMFNIMIYFIMASAFSATLYHYTSNYDYIKNAFLVVSIILVMINSIRVAWIAFLTKKQKLSILALSVIMLIIFIINATLSFDSNAAEELQLFSPALLTCVQLIMIYGGIYFGFVFFTTLFHLPTAEAFDRKSQELSSMMDLNSLMTQVFDFKELAETITTITNKVCNSDSSWLLTINDKKPVLNASANISIEEANIITKLLLGSENEHPTEFIIFEEDDLSKYSVNYINFRSIAIAPLGVQGKINGYLVAGRKEGLSFDEDDKKAITSFGDYAAISLENAKLFKESLEKERMEKELDLAREVQYKLLPIKTPKFNNIEIVATFIPAFEVGGDYYDFFKIKENLMGFIVADVSGKGISSAFIMAEIKGVFQSLSGLLIKPYDILCKANEILCSSLDKKSFITATYGIIELDTGKITVARAGHTPILYCNKQKIDVLTPKGIGLGLDCGEKFRKNLKELEFYLKNDDILVLFSDGITESKNDTLEDFGMNRLTDVIRANCDKQIEVIANKIMSEVSMFSQDYRQHDDITLVIFKWNFNNKSSEIN
ncbi:MAG TPA: SpoIIE family protein phosphatase [Melioribacteraceae bacterium]|nr:SpoIIE family protein phosphatase [Melioribacteraceae bacterium]